MMQKKPANRFPSMRAVEQALREVAASMQVAEAKGRAGVVQQSNAGDVSGG